MQQVLRHTVGQVVVAVPSVLLLDDPVPQMVDTVLDFFRALDQPVDEQVITVPKISTDRVSQRLVEWRLPQIAEQLVEVPTVLTPTRIALQIAEQIVGIPVPRGCGEQRLQGLLPGQGSTSVSSAQRISERTVEQIVDIPGGGLPAFSPGQGSSAVVEQNTLTFQFLLVVEGLAMEVFLVSLPDRVQQRLVKLNTSTFQFLSVVEGWAMEVFTASPRDRAQQRFVMQNMSTFQFLTVVKSWVMVFFRPHQLGLLMRACCSWQ